MPPTTIEFKRPATTSEGLFQISSQRRPLNLKINKSPLFLYLYFYFYFIFIRAQNLGVPELQHINPAPGLGHFYSEFKKWDSRFPELFIFPPPPPPPHYE